MDATHSEEGSRTGSDVEEITTDMGRSKEGSRPAADVEAMTNGEVGSRPGSDVEEITAEVKAEAEWYKALYEEDSKKLMELLEDSDKEALQLWKRGWEKESERRVRGRPRNYWEEEQECPRWLGRTALHVGARRGGARRGNVELLEKVLKLSENEGESSRWSLDNLLLAKDGEYELDAIAMAVVNGNRDVVTTLLEAGWNCSPVRREYDIRRRKKKVLEEEVKDDNHREELRKILRTVIETYLGDSMFRKVILRRYERHRDYNFLPLDLYPEYLFHFLFTRSESVEADPFDACLANTVTELTITEIADKVRSSSAELLKYSWKMQDGQGRPPLHVAIDEERDSEILQRKALTLTRSELSVADDVLRETIRARDGAGRTAVHRAVARGDMRLIPFSRLSFLEKRRIVTPGGLFQGVAQRYKPDEFDEGKMTVAAKAFQDCVADTESSLSEKSTWYSRAGNRYSLKLLRLSKKNGLCENVWTNCAPIHSALLHGHFDDWEEVVDFMHKDHARFIFTDCAVVSDHEHGHIFTTWDDGHMFTTWDTVALAVVWFDAFSKHTWALRWMVHQYQHYVNSMQHDTKSLSGIAISAALGRYDALQFLLDFKLDPLHQCRFQSTLHYATIDDFMQYGIDIFTFVSCEHIMKDYRKEKEKWEEITLTYEKSFNSDEGLVTRQACINRLLQQGCDIFKKNSAGEVPYPKANSKPKFLEWWHEKQLREFKAAQNAQNIASNAISVVAALVATASYVGPLQPPLGYGEDNTGLQLEILAVKVFTICDTMSFYLAIAAIIFALCPCLPMPQQPMLEVLQRTRGTVNIAVACLLPSIICVLVAFTAGSIAVIQAHQTKWTNMIMTSIGGLICLLAFICFSVRVLAIFFHRKPFIKKLYRLSLC